MPTNLLLNALVMNKNNSYTKNKILNLKIYLIIKD